MSFKLDEDTAVLFAVGIAAFLVLTMVAYTALIPKPVEHFLTLSVLGPNHTAEGYPSTVSENQTVNLYLQVENHERRLVYAVVLFKLWNSTPWDYDVEPCPASPLRRFERFVPNEGVWEIPFCLTTDKIIADGEYIVITRLTVNDLTVDSRGIKALDGRDYRMIFELWLYNETTGNRDFTYHSGGVLYPVWCQLWFDVRLGATG